MILINKIIDRVTKIVQVALFLAIVTFFTTHYFLIKEEHKKEATIEIGQVWLYNDDANNPFNSEKPRHRTVLDVKGDYILYVNVFKDTLSVSKRVFIKNSIRVK